MCRGRFAFLPVACCRAAVFFQNPQGRAENAQAWGLETSARQSPGYKFMQSELAASQQFPQKQTGDSRFAAPQRNFSNPTNWVERTRSTAATLPRSSRICTANPQCRNASSQIPRICGSKFAAPQRSSQPLTNLAKPNSQCLNAPLNPSRIWQSQIRSAATHQRCGQ